MQVSKQGVAFIAAHEGVVLKAYRDPVGIVTIGTGFTMRSATFKRWAVNKWPGGLKMGVTITRAENDMLLEMLLNEEYGAAVNRVLPNLTQAQFDAAASVTFNCGPGTLKDRWALALGKGNIAEAARLLKGTRVTAQGKRLAGLVRRRSEEARLLEHADYGSSGKTVGTAVAPSVSSGEEAVKLYQSQLAKLTYWTGAIDGRKTEELDRAVRRFQMDHDLNPDGVVGPATRSALQRAAGKGVAGKVVAGGGMAAAAGAAVVDQLDGAGDGISWGLVAGLGLGAIVLLLALWLAWRYRGVITGWVAKITGR